MTDVRFGVDPDLEDAADFILEASFIGSHASAHRGGILTSYMLAARRAREVQVPGGSPEQATRVGIFGRAYNFGRPDLNARDGLAAAGNDGCPLRAIGDLDEELPGPEAPASPGWGSPWMQKATW